MQENFHVNLDYERRGAYTPVRASTQVRSCRRLRPIRASMYASSPHINVPSQAAQTREITPSNAIYSFFYIKMQYHHLRSLVLTLKIRTPDLITISLIFGTVVSTKPCLLFTPLCPIPSLSTLLLINLLLHL